MCNITVNICLLTSKLQLVNDNNLIYLYMKYFTKLSLFVLVAVFIFLQKLDFELPRYNKEKVRKAKSKCVISL